MPNRWLVRVGCLYDEYQQSALVVMFGLNYTWCILATGEMEHAPPLIAVSHRETFYVYMGYCYHGLINPLRTAW